MAESTLAGKFGIKPGMRVLIINAPDGFSLGDVPGDVTVTSSPKPEGENYDFVILFCRSRAEVEAHALGATRTIKPGAVLYFVYPKGTGAIKSDINRDKGWDVVKAAGWDGVRQISIDSTWSGLRFRPIADINYSPNSTRKPRNP